MTETVLNVEGMGCGHCKAAVEGALVKLPGVEKAKADVERGVVEVSYGDGRVTTEQLEGAIEEAGYTVSV